MWPVTGSICGITHISDCTQESNEIPTAIHMFSNKKTWLDWCEYCSMSDGMRNQSWRSVTGSGCGITHVSTVMHDSNEIQTYTAISMGSGNNVG